MKPVIVADSSFVIRTSGPVEKSVFNKDGQAELPIEDSHALGPHPAKGQKGRSR